MTHPNAAKPVQLCFALLLAMLPLAVGAQSSPTVLYGITPEKNELLLRLFRAKFDRSRMEDQFADDAAPFFAEYLKQGGDQAMVDAAKAYIAEAANLVYTHSGFREAILLEYSEGFSDEELERYVKWLESDLARKVGSFERRDEFILRDTCGSALKVFQERAWHLIEEMKEYSKQARLAGAKKKTPPPKEPVSGQTLRLGSTKKRITGTNVVIDPPDGFVEARQFPGFVMESTGSSIMVTQLPGGPFPEVAKQFTSAALAARGMELISTKQTNVGEDDGVMLHVSQNAYGTEFLKWILVFGSHAETTTVVATFPRQMEEELSALLKQSVLSTEIDQSTGSTLFEGLSFEVAESGILKFAQRIGNSLLLTEDAVFPQKKPGAALVVVGASLSQNWVVPSTGRSFALQRFNQIDVIRAPKVTDEAKVEIDGMEGYWIQAVGVDKDTGQGMYIEQCVLFTTDGYYLFQAMVDEARKGNFIESFGEILRSFRRK